MARYLIRFDPALKEQVRSSLRALGIPVVRAVLDYFVVEIPPDLVPRIREIPGVVEVVPERTFRIAAFIPVEKKAAQLHRLLINPATTPLALVRSAQLDAGKYYWVTYESRKVLGALEADALGIQGEGVKVAVLDTGIDPTLEDLLGTAGESTIEMQPAPLDENGHGSHVASTCCGRGASDPHGLLLGVAPRANVKAFKCLGFGVGTGSTSDIVEAILKAWQWGAKVINMSLGGDIPPDERHDEETDPVCRAIRLVSRDGVIVVAAAGNSGEGYASTPGICSDTITVGAIDAEGRIADFSSRRHIDYVDRQKPEVVVPGVNIHATTATGSLIDVMQWMDGLRRACISGTSMATPHVSGLIALWVDYLRRQGVPDKAINAALIKNIIRRYGKGWDSEYGHGVPRFEWVLDWLSERLGRRAREVVRR